MIARCGARVVGNATLYGSGRDGPATFSLPDVGQRSGALRGLAAQGYRGPLLLTAVHPALGLRGGD